MPYIKERRRNMFRYIDDMNLTEGEMNYYITKMCTKYIKYNGLNYKTINAVIGVLECAKQEFYRRVATPYEDKKCLQNGDVYDI